MNPIAVRWFVVATAASKLGVGIFFLVNTWVVVESTGRPADGAISLMMTLLPNLLLSPALGSVVDRTRHGTVALAALVCATAILCAYGALRLGGGMSATLAYAVSFLIATCGEAQTLAWRAALVRAASADQLLRLNGLTVVAAQSGQVVGAALSGLILFAFGTTSTIFVVAAAFGIAALATWRTLRAIDGRATTAPAPGAVRPSLFSGDLRAAIGHVRATPRIALFYGLIVANMSCIFGINCMLAPFVMGDLHLGPAAFGTIDAGYAVGAVVGGLVLARLSVRIGNGALLVCTYLGTALGLSLLARSSGVVVPTVAYVLIGCSCQSTLILLTLGQRATALSFQGRVSALLSATTGFTGLALYGIIAFAGGTLVSYRTLYTLQAAGLALCVIPVLRGRAAFAAADEGRSMSLAMASCARKVEA